jgi:hypothetical protein
MDARAARAWLDDQRNDPDYAEDLRTKLNAMNRTERIDYLLQKSHFRSDRKVVNFVNQTMKDLGYPIIPPDKILDRNKWHRRKNNYRYFATGHYEYPIFSNHFHAFQIDIIDQTTPTKRREHEQMPEFIQTEPPDKSKDPDDPKDKPPYIYVFQNVNTKYVRAVAMWRKDKESCLRALELLWKDTRRHVMSLVSDKEAALGSKPVKDWLEKKKISLKVITGHRNTALGVINRLIRTLRDMNTPEEKSSHQSHDKKYRDFTIYRIAKLIHIYNHTKHDTTHRIPTEADTDQAWEESWIIKKLYQAEERKRLSDYELEKGDFVRYIIPRLSDKSVSVKRRYSLSPERYKIRARDGHAYVIAARDGTHMPVPRWRLKRCLDKELDQHPWAETITDEMNPKKVSKNPRKAPGEPPIEEPIGDQIGEEPPEPIGEDEIWKARDKFFRDEFDKKHERGDYLIVPSESGNFTNPDKGEQPRLFSDNTDYRYNFHRGHQRIFLPLLIKDIWVLIVITVDDGVAVPKVYIPHPHPKYYIEGAGENVKKRTRGNAPALKVDIANYLEGLDKDIRVTYPQRKSHDGTYVNNLERPAGKQGYALENTFLYIARYAADFLFKNKKPPRENKPMPEARFKALRRILGGDL